MSFMDYYEGRERERGEDVRDELDVAAEEEDIYSGVTTDSPTFLEPQWDDGE